MYKLFADDLKIIFYMSKYDDSNLAMDVLQNDCILRHTEKNMLVIGN